MSCWLDVIALSHIDFFQTFSLVKTSSTHYVIADDGSVPVLTFCTKIFTTSNSDQSKYGVLTGVTDSSLVCFETIQKHLRGLVCDEMFPDLQPPS